MATKRESKKRKDDKGRNLNHGEYQTPDGRYIYIYKDENGKSHRVYSWCLKDSDAVPDDKKCEKSLRRLEDEIAEKISKGIDTVKAKSKTVDEYFTIRLEQSKIKRESTLSNYKYMYEKYIQPVFGSRKIESITNTQIFSFYENELFIKRGFNPCTVGNVNTILSPIFKIAVYDNIIIANPCVRAWETFSAKHSNKLKKNRSNRHSFTLGQHESFMDYVKSNKQKYDRWYNLLFVFLGTGFRVGELLGLTWDDIDFDEGVIKIDHQLVYREGKDGKFEKRITPPKTKSGNREITPDWKVFDVLKDERDRQIASGIVCKDTISGYIGDEDDRIDVELSGFVFLNRYGNVQLPHNCNKAFERIRRDYNEYEIALAKKERRKPVEMPHFSNHVLRHTYCTRQCEGGANPAVTQKNMGHEDIRTTMYYHETQRDLQKAERDRLAGQILIG